MRVALFLLLAAVAAAVPRGTSVPSTGTGIPQPLPTGTGIWVNSTVTVPGSTSLNVPTTTPTLLPTTTLPEPPTTTTSSTRHHVSHWEPIPIFSSACNCADVKTVPYPCWATDALQRCNFEELHSFVCWTSANRGCPTPTRACEDLFAPTPITGRNPCDLGGGGGPESTTAPVPAPALRTPEADRYALPATASAMRTGNAPPLRRWQDMAWNPEHYGVGK